MRRTERNSHMIAEKSSDPRPRNKPASSAQCVSMECADAPDVCNAEQSDVECRVPRGSTVTAEAPWQCKLEFNTHKMDGVKKVLTSEMQV